MNATSEANAPQPMEDPRRRDDFLPQYFPQANGEAPPPAGAEGANDRVVIQFLAAYYELNRAYADLLAARQAAPSPQRKEAERKCLQAVESLLILRDRLEDHYAPFGVIADPVVHEGFTVNVKFDFGNVDAAGRRRSDWYTITACVPVPMPKGAKLEDFPMRIEGPGINPE